MRRPVLILVLTGTLIASSHTHCQESQRPNILFIAVDDLKPQLGCYGDTLAHTPHIDEIAGKGLTFTRNYCQQAVCAPSRASLLTSRYPDQTRVWDLETLMREKDPGIVTLPQYLIEKGYRTAATGKIFDSRSVDQGRDAPSWSIPWKSPWDASYYNPETGKPAYFYASQHAKDTIALLQAEAIQLGVDQRTYVQERYFPAFENADVPVDAYVDGAIAKIGVELLETVAASEDPFFLAIGFQRPHLPFNAPSQFWDLYDREDFKVAPFRENAAGSPAIAYHNYSELRSYTGITKTGAVPDPLQLDLIHGYYAATSYIDHLIGQVLDRIMSLGLENNTVIVLWGDHGWHLGDHQLWCKHSNFEQATRSPLIISYPGQPNPGSHCAAPTEFTDIAPTLCELAGIEIPGYFEGESLTPLFLDTMATVREGSLSQYPRSGKMGYSLRTERYRYTKWTNPDGSAYAAELYDYLLDPLETISYASDPDYSLINQKLDSLVNERISIPSTQHRIRFEVRGGRNGSEPIDLPGVSILMAQENQMTDVQGRCLFTHHSGPINFHVNTPGYITHSGSMLVSGDTLVQVLLEPVIPIYEVLMQVTDQYNGHDLMGLQVTINDTTSSTDYQGQVRFMLEQGEYTVSLHKDYYRDSTFDITVISDTAIACRLTATHATVKFWLKENVTPVNLASVLLNGNEILSNSLGISKFEPIPAGQLHQYSIQKEGYNTINGTIFLVADTTLQIQMKRTTQLGTKGVKKELKIWPNPAGDYICFSFPDRKGIVRIELINAAGQIIQKQQVISQPFLLNLEGLAPGPYWIRFECNGIGTAKEFIKH